MESTKLFKINHHFLEPSLSLDDQNDQTTADTSSSLSGVRRNESEGSISAVFEEPSTAALARHVSISRSGRYKSKSKQRASLLMNGRVDFSSTAVVLFADDILGSPSDAVVVNPPQHPPPRPAASVEEQKTTVQQQQQQQREETSSEHADHVETRTSETPAAVEELAAPTSVNSSTLSADVDVVSAESPPQSSDIKNCLPPPEPPLLPLPYSDDVNLVVCLEPPVAEMDESTDL